MTTDSPPDVSPQEVLDFWLGPPDDEYLVDPEIGERWFKKDLAFDAKIRERFGPAIRAAVAGAYPEWEQDPEHCLALILLLDQLSRNAFRDSAEMYAGDARALAVACAAVDRGFDQHVRPAVRFFYYLPMEHAEDMAMQDRCVGLMERLAAGVPEHAKNLAELPRWAVAHREVVARFGRFPHRNEILGRECTEAENEYLQDPNAGW